MGVESTQSAIVAAIVGYCLIFGLAGAAVGATKGRGVQGFGLGFMLGIIGLIVIALLKPESRYECPHCMEGIHPAATVCPHCRNAVTPVAGKGEPIGPITWMWRKAVRPKTVGRERDRTTQQGSSDPA